MTVRDMRLQLGDTQTEFSARYNIPFRTIQNWKAGVRKPAQYILDLLQTQVNADLVNRKTVSLPLYDHKKIDLPKRSDYIGSLSWLRAVNDSIGSPFVFALDEALMCQGYFGGHNDEYLVWVYGDDSLSRFNGIVVLGNYVSPYCIKESNGLLFTDLNRTITDALTNEVILDMQGITEALSKYYYMNNNSFAGLSPAPEYQDKFEELAQNAIEYYNN